jgi:copper chaperone CopZ
MKSIKNFLMLTFMLGSYMISQAQIKNIATAQVKIYGNCGMCKKTIEKAGNIKNIASVDWDKETKMASISYDTMQTNQDEILKRVALSGYDSDTFLAPTAVYVSLSGCCQYDRVAKTPVKEEMQEKMEAKQDKMKSSEKEESNQLDAVYENYFAIKDALVKTDGKSASTNAKALLESLNAVNMGKLKMDVHMVWMKVMKDLKEDATMISQSTDTKKQRDSFDVLSENIYKLIKVSKAKTTVYFQHCPMANDGKGANWLSKENTINNPYYGSMMLSCGKTVETIK